MWFVLSSLLATRFSKEKIVCGHQALSAELTEAAVGDIMRQNVTISSLPSDAELCKRRTLLW